MNVALHIRRLAAAAVVCWSAAACSGAELPWESLVEKIDPNRDAVAGTWSRTADGLRVEAATGARVKLPGPLPAEYDLRIGFTRHDGRHSIAILFPHGTAQAAYEVDAWGRHLAGIQNIAGRTIQENASRREGQKLENGRRYSMMIEVRRTGVRGLLDGELVTSHAGAGDDLTLSDVWDLADRRTAGLGAWESTTTFHSIELRPAATTPSTATTPTPASVPATTAPTAGPTAMRPTGTRPTAANPTGSRPKATGRPPAVAGGPKRVLIVIANHHFFYREYADPRAALEAAGVQVTVAAGRQAPCRPHPNSGQPAGVDGVVTPDAALAELKAADFDAVLFSGGWGASAYQFAFPGSYQDTAYNGDPATKAHVNRLINEFVAADKPLCGVCNGVSVLAWARVRGTSLLQGRRICAPPGPAAPGVYNGRSGQPSSRWHPEVNGAIIAPAGSIGRPGDTSDDVFVEGKIITAEDDRSAREAGRRLAEMLTAAANR